jgi:flagellar biosynthesis GTPase FlhF
MISQQRPRQFETKSFICNSLPEAVQLIEQQLGAHAYLLHTRQVNQHWWQGFFRKPKVEVIAGTIVPSSLDPTTTGWATSKHPQS